MVDMEQSVSAYGRRRHVHREEVDVFARICRDGTIEPVRVMWRDGRSFPIDEILEAGQFGPAYRGRQIARYRVRFGRHETDLYLERKIAQPVIGVPECLIWWVYAYDQVESRK